MIWLWHAEKLEKQQQALAAQHRHRRRIERFKNLNR
jgi:hypothetical protein